MKDTIKKLYKEIFFIGYYCTLHKKDDYMIRVKKLFPDIQKFVLWYMQQQNNEMNSETESAMQANLLDILRDCQIAMEQQDRVLMMDALEQGLAEYLDMFLTDEDREEINNKAYG